MSKFQEMILQVVDRGIEVTMFKNAEGELLANLHFEAKSHGYLVERDGQLRLDMRYGESHEVEDIDSVLFQFSRAYKMRGFGSQSWLDLCVESGMLEKNVETKTTYR